MKAGSLEVLKWLKKENFPFCRGLLLGNCSIETIEWLLEQRIQTDYCILKRIITNGRLISLDKLKLLWEKGDRNRINDKNVSKAAAEHGSLEILEWLSKNGCCLINSSRIFAKAARKGHFKVMKWLLKNKCPIDDSSVLVAAVDFGSIEQMEWLLKKGCPTDRAMHGAVKHGCLTIMKWLS